MKYIRLEVAFETNGNEIEQKCYLCNWQQKTRMWRMPLETGGVSVLICDDCLIALGRAIDVIIMHDAVRKLEVRY